jgi:hypothetical protein
MNEDTLYYRERFEKVCNAPTKRHAIYPDQYDDSRSQELWTLWKLGIDYERQIQKVLKVYDEDKKQDKIPSRLTKIKRLTSLS